MGKEEYKNIEDKMKKIISVLKEDFANIRAGKANPAILDKVMIDYYGIPTPVNQLGTVSVPEARIITIQPWEAKLLKEIEKAIQKSDININPNNDGKVIRLVFPQLTEERRKELIKTVKKYAEEAKIAIRAIRRDSIEMFKVQKKSGEITEDDLKGIEKDVQNLTDEFIAKIDRLVAAKESEIMEV